MLSIVQIKIMKNEIKSKVKDQCIESIDTTKLNSTQIVAHNQKWIDTDILTILYIVSATSYKGWGRNQPFYLRMFFELGFWNEKKICLSSFDWFFLACLRYSPALLIVSNFRVKYWLRDPSDLPLATIAFIALANDSNEPFVCQITVWGTNSANYFAVIWQNK